MPMPIKGVYIDTGEKGYEVETCYYLRFQIKAVRICIERLKIKKDDIDSTTWDDICDYYHYYCDHLVFSLGQISNRFRLNENKNRDYNSRIEENRRNFNFDNSVYPIISAKDVRNLVEHIDEYNIATVEKVRGVGGFNVIFDDMKDEIKDRIQNSENEHPYNYDAVNHEIVVYKSKTRWVVSLEELSREISNLEEYVVSFQTLLTS